MHYAKYGKVQHFKLKLSYKAFELFHVSELTRKPQNWVTRRGLVVERRYRKRRVPGSNPALAKITQTGFFHHLSPSLNNTTLLKMEHRFSQQRKQKMLESSSRVFKWAHHVPYSPLPFIRNHPAIRMILVENPLPVLAIKRSCCILDDERKCHINHPEEASSNQINQTMGNTIATEKQSY